MLHAGIDTAHPAYLEFQDWFCAGASLQDIYTDSEAGYGVRRRSVASEPDSQARVQAECRHEFARVFEHQRNLVLPLSRHIDLKDLAVLDFGCGTGALAVALALAGARVTAVDPTEASLQACQARARYFGLAGTALATCAVQPEPGLPFPDRPFDLVTCNSVMEFIPRARREYVQDMVRLLRPGGTLVISGSNGHYPRDYYSGAWFPYFRRREMQARNLPFGLTYPELKSWVKGSGRRIDDLSTRNWFNSVDNLAARQRHAGRHGLSSALQVGNKLLKSVCTTARVPSCALLPYATYLFRVH
jgi:2-polyprenyl-3-methyl-5-hydroxy-6-metoxy-1,4-benzoquinol methylase